MAARSLLAVTNHVPGPEKVVVVMDVRRSRFERTEGLLCGDEVLIRETGVATTICGVSPLLFSEVKTHPAGVCQTCTHMHVRNVHERQGGVCTTCNQRQGWALAAALAG